MITVDSQLLDQLTEMARISPRRRINHNFHKSDNSACHRLLNAMEPDSYIRPHRHLDPEKDETCLLLRGRLGFVCFDENGIITEFAALTACTDQAVVTIPSGVFHTAVSLASGSIFFESKSGPYMSLNQQEIATWSPDPTEPEAALYLRRLCDMFS